MSERATRHPEIYTPPEAAAYLGVTEAQLPEVERDYKLVRFGVGRAKVYSKQNLDDVGLRMVGIEPPARNQPAFKLKIGGR